MKKLLLLLLLIPTFAFAKPAKPIIYQLDGDKFSKFQTFKGLQQGQYPLFGTSVTWFIRGRGSFASNEVNYQLYVTTNYQAPWHFYRSANDDEANSLEFVEIDSSVGFCNSTCFLYETFGITLPEEKLIKSAEKGFQIKIYSKSGYSEIITISPLQIQSALMSANQLKSDDKKWINPYLDENGALKSDASKDKKNCKQVDGAIKCE